MLSFIIPAYNEASLIGQCLDGIREAARSVGVEHELIVVDDASTDATASIAMRHGARIVPVHKRHIAAVRNAGAAHARGSVLVFVDADTMLPSETLRQAVQALEGGAVGGGSRVELADDVPWIAGVYFALFNWAWRPFRLAAGCFIFARREAFVAACGFDERYYASEEIWLSRALKRQGRFVIVKHPVLTSGRKARLNSTATVLGTALKLAIKGPRSWRRREGLEFWYDGRREPPQD